MKELVRLWWLGLFCKHEFVWRENIYGDRINHHDGMRSEWLCNKCFKFEYRPQLHKEGA